MSLIKSMKGLAEVIGSAEINEHIIPALTELSSDKNWRVKLAALEFVPVLCQLPDKNIFQTKLEEVVLGWLSDPVF